MGGISRFIPKFLSNIVSNKVTKKNADAKQPKPEVSNTENKTTQVGKNFLQLSENSTKKENPYQLFSAVKEDLLKTKDITATAHSVLIPDYEPLTIDRSSSEEQVIQVGDQEPDYSALDLKRQDQSKDKREVEVSVKGDVSEANPNSQKTSLKAKFIRMVKTISSLFNSVFRRNQRPARPEVPFSVSEQYSPLVQRAHADAIANLPSGNYAPIRLPANTMINGVVRSSNALADRRQERMEDKGPLPEMSDAIRPLGMGEFGEVAVKLVDASNFAESAKKRYGKRAAVKTAKDTEVARADIQKEMDVLNYLRTKDQASNFIPKVFWAQGDHIIQKICKKGSMKSFMESDEWMKMPWTDRLQILSEAAKAVSFLSENGVIHNDIAARNFLVHQNKEGKYKIYVSDFGMAQILDRNQTSMKEDSEGKPMPLKWLAPERYDRVTTAKSDNWSFGVFLIESIIGNEEFKSMDRETFKELLKNKDPGLMDVLKEKCKEAPVLYRVIDGLIQNRPGNRLPLSIVENLLASAQQAE